MHPYYYIRNGQGDVIGLFDSNGNIVARYSYDSWGNLLKITDGAGNDKTKCITICEVIIMNLFACNMHLKSYTYPIVKILICIIVIIILINRNYIVYIEKTYLNIVVGLICAIVGMMCILCVYISFAEIICVSEKRGSTEISSRIFAEKAKNISVDEVLSLVKNNDIIEIDIIFDNALIKMGTSSDCNYGSSKFFDKLYYIGSEEFIELDKFKLSLNKYSINDLITVLKIDGIFVK